MGDRSHSGGNHGLSAAGAVSHSGRLDDRRDLVALCPPDHLSLLRRLCRGAGHRTVRSPPPHRARRFSHGRNQCPRTRRWVHARRGDRQHVDFQHLDDADAAAHRGFRGHGDRRDHAGSGCSPAEQFLDRAAARARLWRHAGRGRHARRYAAERIYGRLHGRQLWRRGRLRPLDAGRRSGQRRAAPDCLADAHPHHLSRQLYRIR